jgi:hypothetical protein
MGGRRLRRENYTAKAADTRRGSGGRGAEEKPYGCREKNAEDKKVNVEVGLKHGAAGAGGTAPQGIWGHEAEGPS